MNHLINSNGQPNGLCLYLMSELSKDVSMQQKTVAIQKGITAVTEHVKQHRTVLDMDTMLLILFDDYFDLYKSIPKYIVERFSNVLEVNLHIHIIRGMEPDEGLQYVQEYSSESPDETSPYTEINLEFGSILQSPETGNDYICEDSGEWRYCVGLDVLISVLEALKYFQNSLYELAKSGQYEKYQIFIDEVEVKYYNGNSDIMCSIDTFVDEFLTGLKYKYDFYNWREYYV